MGFLSTTSANKSNPVFIEMIFKKIPSIPNSLYWSVLCLRTNQMSGFVKYESTVGVVRGELGTTESKVSEAEGGVYVDNNEADIRYKPQEG